MQVTILGATGRIGSLVLHGATKSGHDVVALTRRPVSGDREARVSWVSGDIVDIDAVRRSIAGSAVVIATLGPGENSSAAAGALEAGMRNVVQVMSEGGVGRLIALSGAAVDVPGDSKPVVDRIVSRLVRVAARHVVGAKQREFEVFSATDLDWTAVRPAIVTNGEPRGYRLSERLTPGARVTRADVAAAIVSQIDDATFLRKAPFVLPPDRRSDPT